MMSHLVYCLLYGYFLFPQEFLQILQRQLVLSQVLVFFLKAATDSIFFASSFRVFDNIAPLNLRDFILYFSMKDR